MNAEDSLLETYEEWGRQTQAEGEAIRTSNWNLVAECQNALRELQPRIICLTGEARKEWVASGVDCKAKEQALRDVVGELIVQEQQNNALLSSLRDAVQSQLGELNQTSRNLKRLHHSYAPASRSSGPAWTSFS